MVINGRHGDEQVARQPGATCASELAAHGVDAVRLTMVFAGPPEDDIDWADVSPTGVARSSWRGPGGWSGDVARPPGVDPATGDPALRTVTHRDGRTRSTRLVESFRFNVAVARVMELVNATRKAIDSGAGRADPAVREAVEAVAVHAVACSRRTPPRTCGRGWATSRPSALAGWPAVDPVAAGRGERHRRRPGRRARCATGWRCRRTIAEDELRSWRWRRPAVRRALGERGVRTVVVRPPKLVNVVPG